MIGGRVQQVIDHDGFRFVEVLDHLVHGDRVWRSVHPTADVQEGDSLWWQSFVGFLTRHGSFVDRNIGTCKPACSPAELKETTT
jgi:hypothetical protein